MRILYKIESRVLMRVNEAYRGSLMKQLKYAVDVVMMMTVLFLSASALATANYVYHGPEQLGPGCASAGYRQPASPNADAAVQIFAKVEYAGYTNSACLIYTTDGSRPSGTRCVASGTSHIVSAAQACSTTDNLGLDIYQASIPAQAAGTTVKYIVSAWHSDGGDEIFANSGTCSGCGNCTTSACANVFSYQIPGIQDAGTSSEDSASVDVTVPDAATNQDAQIADASSAADALAADSAAASDAGSVDSMRSDASMPDVTQVDSATVFADAAQLDAEQDDAADASSIGDARLADNASPDDVNPGDSSTEQDQSSSCTASCRDAYYRIDCAADGTPIVLACPSGTLCEQGHCVDGVADAGNKDSTDAGCACSSAVYKLNYFGYLTLLSGLALLAWRRRRV